MPLKPKNDAPTPEITKSGPLLGGNIDATPPWATTRVIVINPTKDPTNNITATGNEIPVRHNQMVITIKLTAAPATAAR